MFSIFIRVFQIDNILPQIRHFIIQHSLWQMKVQILLYNVYLKAPKSQYHQTNTNLIVTKLLTAICFGLKT